MSCHFVSLTLSFLKWLRSVVYIRIWTNLWFSHFHCTNFVEKLIVSWYQMQSAELGELLHEGPCVGYPLSAGCLLGAFGRVPDMPPSSKVIAVHFVWLIAKNVTNGHTSLQAKNNLGVACAFNTIYFKYQILGYSWYVFAPKLTLHMMWCADGFF